jgi:hypothetical protein
MGERRQKPQVKEAEKSLTSMQIGSASVHS